MARDYNSADFNAYNSGIGELMQSSKAGDSEAANISLFVSNVPTTLSKVDIIILFFFLQSGTRLFSYHIFWLIR